jgi:ribosomal protein S18 acetylase RimI-like enzyme
VSVAVSVRRLRLADYEAIIAVFDVCGLTPRVRGRDSRQNLAKQLRSRGNVFLGAFDGQRLVGTVFATHDTRKGWINRLAVLPEYRHRGIAKRLVRAAERGLRRQGIEMFAALIDSDNVASRSLFARLGYDTQDILYYRRKLRDDI